MKKIFFYCPLLVFFMSSCAQSADIKIYIYSRATMPGIRPDSDMNQNIFPKKYFIYAEVKKDTKVAVEGYWIEGKYYTAAGFEKVSSPVIITDQTVIKEQKDILVKKTANDVYQVITGEETSRAPANEAEKKSVAENRFVLILKVNGKLKLIPCSKIKELTPSAMM